MTSAQDSELDAWQAITVRSAPETTHRGSGERGRSDAHVDLRLLLDSAAEGFCAIDRTGVVTFCNAAFLCITGFARDDEVIGKDFHGLIHHSRADGSPYPRSDCPVLNVAQTGLPAHVVDEVFGRADGTVFPVEYWARPIFRESSIEGAVCTFVDITARKRDGERRRILTHELTHRVKNTLAVVQAIVDQTLRNTGDLANAVRTINWRLVALSRAHEVLTRTQWDGAAITDVIDSGLVTCGPGNPRVRIDGPELDLGSNTALALTMALHELCTNAVKYGALSNDTGTVSLAWALETNGAEPALHLCWRSTADRR